MHRQNQKTKKQAYKQIILCAGAIVLGCVIPVIIHTRHETIANGQLAAMEAVGGLVMLYVFGEYLVKK